MLIAGIACLALAAILYFVVGFADYMRAAPTGKPNVVPSILLTTVGIALIVTWFFS